MRADQWLMIGVGALGAYAVYRLVTAPKVQSEPIPGAGTAVLPDLPTRPTTPLPLQAGPIDLVPNGFPIVATSRDPSVHLTNSRAYRGRLELPPNASDEDVLGLMAAFGFDDPGAVRVLRTPAEAAPHVPSFALANPGSGTRWFHARYLGTTRDVARPPELVAMWIAPGPLARA